MKIECFGADYGFEMQALSLLFFPNTKFADDSDGRRLKITVSDGSVTAGYEENGELKGTEICRINRELYDAEKAACKRAAFTLFAGLTGIRPAWGLLTGIRPAVFYLKIRDMYGTDADRIMTEEYLVAPEKLELCKKVCKYRLPAVESACSEDVCLYISVPFCPSRCKYCSFVSCSTRREHGIIPEYLTCLSRELERKAAVIRERKQRLVAVYIGGGTPTVLTAEQLSSLLGDINGFFDLKDLREFTVEAGRPDTITDEKLDAMRQSGVDRISVNPQTLDDEILRLVGRKHTAAQFFDVYAAAKARGFWINVDLIAGLPTQTADSFRDGLEKIISLKPENLTVHTLYIKRAADYGLAHGAGLGNAAHVREVGKMLEYTSGMCADADLVPYYMYRQKNTVGNNENVGYAVEGKECLYNIWMMDDILTVYGCGAGAMTKIPEKTDNGTIIRRISNTKFAYNYIKDGASDI